MEASHSGLVRSLGKRVRCQSFRGFESLRLRQKNMINRESEIYDRIYSNRDEVYGSGPEESIKELLNHIQPGPVLELGAGEGRNALFLASEGFDVSAVDVSAVGLNKIQAQAKEKGLEIDTVLQDINNLDLTKNYDAIVSTFTLHHLSMENGLRLIEQLKEHTNPDGVNILVTFTKDSDFYKQSPQNFFPDENILREIYKDWEIIHYQERETAAVQTHPDGSPYINGTAEITAKKIN
jgi:tellurite methyltransferase